VLVAVLMAKYYKTKKNNMKKIYAVLCVTKSAIVKNEIVKLDKGNYIIPAFDDYDKAKEYAGEAFQVIEFKNITTK
jgi:hypothetical protein